MKKISKFGLRIKNIEASTLFEYNNGIRTRYECKDAMFTNSLFNDFLKENGLNILNGETTKDIICLEFNYGSRSYEDEIKHLRKIALKARLDYKISKSKKNKNEIKDKYNKIKNIASIYLFAINNSEKYIKKTKEELRTFYYNHGVDVNYITYKKNDNIKKTDKIHYKMLYRSTGKAKKGSCMFINVKLYEKAKDFLNMGIELDDNNPMIVELGAYSPLVSSTIVDKIKINPQNILILKDVEKTFITNIISVETDENNHCVAKKIDNYELKNILFDGQALIDSSIFPKWANGYLLLRHHFCKMASFNTNIQQFFKDYFGENYFKAKVKDMFGVEHFVKDIKLITTDNAMKWTKFNKSYDYWCKKVNENDCMFGVVKTAHKSKLGNVQKMSYQMVNSLDYNIMNNVVKESLEYIYKLKSDNNTFLDYLKKNKNFFNDYEVLVALCEQNIEFTRSEYFRTRKKKIIETYTLNLKTGKIIQNAENLVIVGSPYAMLLYSAEGNEDIVNQDDTFTFEKDTIQCYTERFDFGDYLAFFRSPFNSKNNLTYLHNVYHEKIKKYFNFGKQIVAVNMIGTDFQDRNNGSDQDSDSGYCTNQKDIVEHAKKCYIQYPTIVNNIPKEKTTYTNTMDSHSLIDNNLANASLAIGESSNLAQIAQTYTYNFDNSKYIDYVCILSVLAQVAIDNTKRRFDIDLTEEIRLIKKNMDISKNGYPVFWDIIKKNFNKKKINKSLQCPMNYLYELEIDKFRDKDRTLPMDYFFQKFELDKNRKKCKKVEELISTFSLDLYEYNIRNVDDEYILLQHDYNKLLNEIRKIYISKNYLGLMSWLIDRAFLTTPNIKNNKINIQSTINTNKSILLKTLYNINSKNLLKCFSKNL